MHRIISLMIFLAAALGIAAAESVPYGVGTWPEQLGNHRAVVQVDRPSEAVWIRLPWRRRDADSDKKAVLVFDAATRKQIRNVVVGKLAQACGEIAFQPATVPGRYYVYYMPMSRAEPGYSPEAAYTSAHETADIAWRVRVGLTAESLKRDAWRSLPEARMISFEAIDEHDKFTPMERTASPEEVARLLSANPQASYLLFPEDREHPIRMRDFLPKRWIDAGPRDSFEAIARRGEFYAFQIGVFAARRSLENVAVVAEDLQPRSADGSPIPASAIRCFNQGGVDSCGKPLRKTIAVEKGKVAALWFGLQVPLSAKPGRYEGAIHVDPAGTPGKRIVLRMEIDREALNDAGDSEPWRHSRLRWLNSAIAVDDEPVAPFVALSIWEKAISCLGRDVELEPTGLPGSIRSRFTPEVTGLVTQGREILAGPIRFLVQRPDGMTSVFAGESFELVKRSKGATAWKYTSRAGDLRLDCRGEMEFDGHITFSVQAAADRETPVSDLRLEIPLRRDAARYMMGMGRPGGLRPAEYQWRWDRRKNQDSVWLGDVNAGLRCQLFGENYRRPLINVHYHHVPLNLPPAWYNDGRGGCSVREEPGNRVILRATSGPRTLKPGQTLHFNFALLITPLKLLDTDSQWAFRYYHAYHSPAQVAQTGANVINIHHGSDINPYINYPFLRTDGLKRYVDEAHAKGLKVKIYYTTRELSNHAVELWALRSLGDEVLAPGPGGGHAWLQEHLDPPYVPGWHTPPTHDVACVTMGDSRWHNYYLEGLDWLARNVGIDGLYLDDLAYDRTVMKRVRKILERRRPGAQIDLHSWNHFNERAGYACCLDLYMEHLAYIDRVWIGEERNYNTPPDYWLVEISGIPFGVMGEMLQDGGNPWRGMIYGMTARLPYMADPRPIWKVWDEFRMKGSQMIPYWSPDCPVRCSQPSVLSTVYRQPKKSLISIASWAAGKVNCRLTIDFAKLGIHPAKARLRAPAVLNFQPAATFRPGDEIPIDPGRGWLMILDEENP
jgi:hypothetical protein